MRNLLTSTLIAGASIAALSLTPSTAGAQTVPSPQLKPSPTTIADLSADIAIAKVRNGKLVLAPFVELPDFAELEMRLGNKIGFTPITPDYVSRTIHARGSADNSVDEIRMTAAANGGALQYFTATAPTPARKGSDGWRCMKQALRMRLKRRQSPAAHIRP